MISARDEILDTSEVLASIVAASADWPAEARRVTGFSEEVIEGALKATGLVPPVSPPDATRLALLLLTTRPSSGVVRLLQAAARATFRRYRTSLEPYVDETDLLSMLRWRLWEHTPADVTSAAFPQYLRLVAQALSVSQIRALGRHGWLARSPATSSWLEELPAEASTAHDLDLVSVADELVTMVVALDDGDVFLAILLDEVDRDQALEQINARRKVRGEREWTMEALRTALHRLRARLRAHVHDSRTSG